jgi:formylglycine-generating enzyme required for sulfatase activity
LKQFNYLYLLKFLLINAVVFIISIDAFCQTYPDMARIPSGNVTGGVSDDDLKFVLQEFDHTLPNKIIPFTSKSFIETAYRRSAKNHVITITQPFYISSKLISVEQYGIFVKETNHISAKCLIASIKTRLVDEGWMNPDFKQTLDDPVVCISWQDANAYCKWLNTKNITDASGLRLIFRLPTENEAEYAIRGGSSKIRWWGNAMLDDIINCLYCQAKTSDGTTPPSVHPKNPFGLFDALGNAMIWTNDCWNPQSNSVEDRTSSLVHSCEWRVVKSSSWGHPGWAVASGLRGGGRQDAGNHLHGFRVIAVPLGQVNEEE